MREREGTKDGGHRRDLSFPDTNAVLGLNDAGEIALDDRSGVEIPITITARDAESNAASRLSILGQSYERVSD